VVLILRTSADLPAAGEFDYWTCVSRRRPVALPEASGVADLGYLLEEMFLSEQKTWWSLGKDLATEPTAGFAHMPSCAGNVSDFGYMLAWTRVAESWAASERRVCLICDDPWLFRHLSNRPGVESGRAPGLWFRETNLTLRGVLSRFKVSLSMLAAWILLPRLRQRHTPTIIAYCHPSSTAEGFDGYFGKLLSHMPGMTRVLHVDCSVSRIKTLGAQRKGAGLSAFGNPFAALTLIAAKWRPTDVQKKNWLVRRAAALEGGTGSAAMIKWQTICQKGWLRSCRPAVVAWPWENHSWERELVREARRQGIRTVGYQHSVVGGAMLNYAQHSNPDDGESIPDWIISTGDLWAQQLSKWGIPDSQIRIGGTWRAQQEQIPLYDPSASMLVVLPFNEGIGKEMIAAVKTAAGRIEDFSFLIKQHPMNPLHFQEELNCVVTEKPFDRHERLSGVIFAASTVGIESYLAGIPTVRFLPGNSVAPSLAEGLSIPVASSETLCHSLQNLLVPPPLSRDGVFAQVDHAVWQAALGSEE